MKSKLSGCIIDFTPNFKLKLKDQIGTGSFSYVYSTNDPHYVVKMINASDQKSLHSYKNEKYAFQNIQKNDNIIHCPHFKDSIVFKDINYCCLVLEYCPRGSIINMIVDKGVTFQENQILQIFLDVLLGLHQMHSLPQPIAHRDLKGENVLLGEDGHFKLTDFGSISVRRFSEINEQNREIIQEDIDVNTTPTIRGPEQCNLYSGFPISEKVDIWALGCLLFIMCFHKQPFETRLSTVNCQYFISNFPKYSKPLLNLFPMIFVIDPRQRPNTTFLLQHFDSNFYSLPKGVFLKEPASRDSIKPQQTPTKNPKEKEAKYISNFGDFGKDHLPSDTAIKNSSKIRPSLKAKWQKYIKTLTTKTEAWILNALEETDEAPNQKYVRFLIIKAWQKPQKIKKFYTLLHKKFAKNHESTIITLKTLIVVHNYIKKGPNEVLSPGATPHVMYPKELLKSISEFWKNVLENNLSSNRDKLRDPYTNNVIVEYSSLLDKKGELTSKYLKIIEGNYSLNPFISNPQEDNNPLQASFIDELLYHLQSLMNFQKIILTKNHLWKIQSDIALAVLDEEYCLISLLTHLMVTLKKASNYPSRTVDRDTFLKLEEKFVNSYSKLIKLFENTIKMKDFEEYSEVIPFLPKQIVQGIQSIPSFNNYNGNYYAKDHLNTHKSIYGLKIPISYGDFVKEINLQRIIEEVDLTEPNVSHPQPVENQGLRKIEGKVETKTKHENKTATKETEKSVKVESEDFKPNFDAFNKFQNFQNFESIKTSDKTGNETANQNDIYAGFNFGQPRATIEVEKQDKQQVLSPETPFKDVSDEIIGTEARKELDKFKNIRLRLTNGLEITEPDQVEKENKNEKPLTNENNEIPLTLDDAITSVGRILDPHIKPSLEDVKENEYDQLDENEEDENNSPPKKKEEVSLQEALQNKLMERNKVSNNLASPKELLKDINFMTGDTIHHNPNLQIAFENKTPKQDEHEENSPSLKDQEENKKSDYLNLSEGDAYLNLDEEMKSPVYEPDSTNEKESKQVENIETNKVGTFWSQTQDINKESGPLGLEHKNKSNPITQGSLRRNLFLQGAVQTRDKPSDINKLHFQSAEEEVKLEEIIQEQINPGLETENILSKKLENLAKSQFRGDSGVELERSNSIPSKENLTEKGTPVHIEDPGTELLITSKKKGRVLSGYQEKKSLYYSGLTNPQEEEERKKDPYHQEIGESNFESLLGKSKSQYEKPPMQQEKNLQNIQKNRSLQNRRSFRHDSLPDPKIKGIALEKEEEKEWESTFDINKNSLVRTRQNSRGEIPSNPNLENSSLSGQEINSDILKNFIYNEVTKNKNNWIINYNQLKFLNKIGDGASAHVYKGLWRGTEVAIKRMSLTHLSENRKKEFEREISALMKLRPHTNLVNLMGVSLHENDLCIITEFCSGGTLFEWLHERKSFNISWKQKVKMAHDIACGMHYLHTCDPPIVHRDLKSLNLLLDGPLEEGSKRFTVKLADFGLAKTEDPSQETKTGLTGTFHWMAPEIFDNKVYTVKADVYSFAIVLWEILTRETPYYGFKTPLAIMRYVTLEKKRPDMSKIPNNCPKELIQLMEKCWAHEPQDRPDFAEVLEKLKFLMI